MAERKPISKKLRFEVFKRDSFKCQYCGKASPDVVLEIDHIKPVAEGGKNEIMNLITACSECNSGKGKRELTDSAAVTVQKKQLDDMQQRREQMKLMLAWREELLELEEEQVTAIGKFIYARTEWDINSYQRADLKALIKRFGFSEVCEATEIAFSRYCHEYISFIMNKIGGICYNRKYRQTGDRNA